MNKGKEVDWIIHAVNGDRLVFHTHNAAQYCGKELELNLSVASKQGMMILNTVVLHCRDNEIELKDGMVLTEVFTVPIHIVEIAPIEAHSLEERVLRVVVPDENGKFPNEAGCNPNYRQQIDTVAMH